MAQKTLYIIATTFVVINAFKCFKLLNYDQVTCFFVFLNKIKLIFKFFLEKINLSFKFF